MVLAQRVGILLNKFAEPRRWLTARFLHLTLRRKAIKPDRPNPAREDFQEAAGMCTATTVAARMLSSAALLARVFLIVRLHCGHCPPAACG